MEPLPPVELRYLRYFIAVAEELNYRQAAKRLHVSAPALSVQIKHLEGLLDTRLLERNTAQVRLTTPGEVLLREARKIVQHMGDLVQATKDASRGEGGRLRIGIHGQFGENFIPEMLIAYEKAFSKVEVTLLDFLGNEGQLKALEEGITHIGTHLDFEPPRIKGLGCLLLAELPMRAVMSVKHPLAASRQVTLKQMAALPLLAVQQYEPQTQSLLELFHREKLRPARTMRANSFHACVSMLASGKGVALLPEINVITQNPRLAVRPVKDAAIARLRMRVHAIWKEANASPHTLNLIDMLRKTNLKQG